MKVDYEAVRELTAPTVLIDARSPQRFRGEVEPVDPVAGHIPGARNAPWEENLGPDGRLRSPQELRQRFAALDIHEGSYAVAYCGSGVTACMNLLALEVAGLSGARLYPGSWSDWSNRPDAEVATGL
jgi:thiosulfate/3-mercaptopyruvate sulfurtransferase